MSFDMWNVKKFQQSLGKNKYLLSVSGTIVTLESIITFQMRYCFLNARVKLVSGAAIDMYLAAVGGKRKKENNEVYFSLTLYL